MTTLPEPSFINRDPQAIMAEIVAAYEQQTGKTLYPAQVERLLLDVIAYRETLMRIGIQEAAKQNLVAYARAPMLDYLGELVGVRRLLARPASTTLRFSVAGELASNVRIPAGTRVEGMDGAVTFATDTDVTLLAGALSIDAPATCEQVGLAGNAWQPGQINIVVDDLADADVSAVNTTTTSGGVEAELDDRLRDRIRLAPESFSVAGSKLAYRHHTLSAHQDIVDVAISSPSPGTVLLHPLLTSGLPDAQMISLISAALTDERVRPLTDLVIVQAPAAATYLIDAQFVLYDNVDAELVLSQARIKAEEYRAERAAGLGRDIVPSQLLAALHVPGVYQASLTSPSLMVLADHEWAQCTDISLAVTGVANG